VRALLIETLRADLETRRAGTDADAAGRPAVSRVLCKQFRIGAVFFEMLFSLLPQALGVVGKWESWFLDFHFPTTHNLILRFFPV